MARRTGRAPAPAASGAKAPRSATRPQRTGPKSIHDVYDYAVNQETDGKRGKADRSIRRAKLGAARTDMDDLDGPSRRNPGKQRQSEGGDGDSDIDSASDDSRSQRQAGPSFLDVSDEEADGVDSEDDSDIDSDGAFGESEDEMGGGSAKAGRRRGDDDDDDESGAEDFEDDQGSDVVDLSRLLDDDDAGGDVSMLGSDDGDGEDDEDDDDDGDDDEDEDVDDRLSRLAASYAQSAAKRSADDDGDAEDDVAAQSTKRQRRLLSARTEAVPESEYAATSSTSRGQNIGIEDLLGSLSKGTAGDLSALRTSTKALRQSQPGPDARQPVASRRGGGALAAPLPDVVKDRIQRAAGYDLSKEEADKWQSTIKRLREAEHLSFPLQGGPSRPKATTAQMAASYKPSNALEQDIEGILQAQGLSESQIAKHEELAMRKIDPEEAQRRRDELRQMRELMFRAEQKAKRTNKIKSKAFRKIARKDKERQREKMIAAGILPGDDDEDLDVDGEADEARRAKAERLRAKERATLKHKNTGKWAKAAVGRGENDDETRDAINEQLQRGEQLRKRIQGRDSEDDSSDDVESDSESGDAVQNAFDEIRALDAREEAEATADGAAADNTGKKGVWNMKFMRDARNREDAVAKQSRRDLEDELRNIGDSDDGDDDDDDDDDDDGIASRQPAIGRRVFESKGAPASRSGEKTIDARAQSPADSGEEDEPREVPAPMAAARSAKHTRRSLLSSGATPAAADDDDGSNPWLMASTSKTRNTTAAPVTQSSSAASKSALRLDKHKSKGQSARAEADDDAHVEIDPAALISGGTKKSSAVQLQPPPPRVAPKQMAREESDSDGDGDSDDDEPIELQSKGRHAYTSAQSQRALIAEAFAGDDVTSDFAASKAAAIATDAPQEVSDDLPGWGSWGGKGAKRGNKGKRTSTKVIPGLDPSKRKDAKMANVIINERRDKKLDKYHAKELPYPYTSAKQYQAAIAQPIGPEWNTTTQNQRLVMPRVLQTKPGSVIKPVKRVG